MFLLGEVVNTAAFCTPFANHFPILFFGVGKGLILCMSTSNDDLDVGVFKDDVLGIVEVYILAFKNDGEKVFEMADVKVFSKEDTVATFADGGEEDSVAVAMVFLKSRIITLIDLNKLRSTSQIPLD